MQSVSVQNLEQVGRVMRKPAHTFTLKEVRPFQIQPVCIAPVLPGETMERALLQARIVTDPLANSMIGWWAEFYFFYVKFSDLDEAADLTDMMLDPEKDMSSHDASAVAPMYHYGDAETNINFVQLCLKRITETYFRDEGEAWDDYTTGSLPLCKINTQDIRDSLILEADVETAFDVDLTDAGGIGGATVTAAEIDEVMRQYEWMRQNTMINMSYEDYLATFGVRTQKENSRIPKLLRYMKDWTYPTNTVDPSTGTPSSAAVWSISERLDKKRSFREPGFIFAVQVLRPKVYSATQRGTLSSWMNKAQDWLPAVLSDDPYASMRKFTGATGPYPGIVDDYLLDIKDLLLHGEQFLNFDPAAADGDGAVTQPSQPSGTGTPLVVKYPTTANGNSLFADTSTPKYYAKSDGVINFGILGRQVDTTPSSKTLQAIVNA